ncbi:YafY family protein [uncultured Alistipes sp.]|uniref:helix-turn-helix transcriptional regulator n=1 Tax=uncultured Alistipes sp. TaxID=538949 RepID=UPI00266BCBBC|nr:WYL domain-containing protein [uncultured Alistipes sp.]
MTRNRKTRSSSKSNAATLFNRYVWLVDTIYRAGRITFEEINERWQRSSLNETGEELPLKTFHNHKNAIQQMFDINIECDRRGGYLYYIEHAEDMERGGVRTWLLNTFAVNHLINESHHLKRRILFEEIPSGQRFLTQIIEAMRDNRTLEMSYQSFWDETTHTFEVAPYCVKVFRQRWYVVACSASDDRLRIYALDRIRELRTSEHLFILPDDFDPQAYFANSFGIAVDESYKPEQVRVRVSGIQRHYLRTLPLHASQQEIEITNDSSVFEFYLRPTLDFQQELLTHAANTDGQIEVLKPQWLREQMEQIGLNLFNTHSIK